MISRKDFIRQSTLFMAGTLSGALLPGRGPSASESLTILFTNDTHARIEPFPQTARNFAGLGGISRRAALVKKIRYNSDHTLLLDAGDVFYGTPWFDVFRGSVDFRVMSSMGYDAMTPGEHEFKYGADLFLEAAKEAGFPFLAANYRAKNADLNSLIEDQIIREYSGFNVGVFGIGIDLNSQIENGLEKEINTLDTVRIARRAVNSLRLHHHCDYVICLSHLGLSQESGGIDDLRLAESVSGIDLIIGGHTHTFLDQPIEVTGADGKKTYITQMGHSGIRLGRVDLPLSDEAVQNNLITSRYYTIGE